MSSSSTIVAIIMAVLLFLQMHACIAARNPTHFHSFTKLQDVDKTKLIHEIGINDTFMFKEEKQLSQDVASDTLVKNATKVMEMQDNFEGKARGMQETRETKEAIEFEGEPIEEATVEDYVQIHHKSPIHNHH